MTKTPKTDAAALGFARILVDREKWSTIELVEANFARALERREAALEEALREGLNLQSRWPLDKKIYPDEAAWIAKVRALLTSDNREG